LVKVILRINQTFLTKYPVSEYSKAVKLKNMKKYLLLLTVTIFFTKLPAQNFNANQNEADNKEPKIVINHEIIQRFHEVKTEGDIYSWSQVLTNSQSNNVLEFMAAYNQCNLEEQSLEGIRLALEQKSTGFMKNSDVTVEEYYAFLNRIKQEISDKLSSTEAVAMK
jgi:hypothetical protein